MLPLLHVLHNCHMDHPTYREKEPTPLMRIQKEPQFTTYNSIELYNSLLETMGDIPHGKKALETALRLHIDQKKRPDGPYINHIMRVTKRVVEEYGVTDPDILVAAILHDSLEDALEKLVGSDGTLDDGYQWMADQFGEEAAKIIKALTTPSTPDDMSREEKYASYFDHMNMLAQNSKAIVIKISDFSDNALKVHDLKPQRRARLSKKYAPVIPLLIAGLQQDGVPMPDTKRKELIQTLTELKTELETFAEEFDN